MLAHVHALWKAMTSLQLTSLAMGISGMFHNPRNWRQTRPKRARIEHVWVCVVIVYLLMCDGRCMCWSVVGVLVCIYIFTFMRLRGWLTAARLANLSPLSKVSHSFLCLFILAVFHKTLEASSKTQSLFIQQDPLDRNQPKQNTPCCVIVIYLWGWNPGLVAGVLVGICVCYGALEWMRAI